MGTFFHGGNSSSSEMESHTLYLLNPSSSTTTPYVHYSDSQPLLLHNPNSPGPNLSTTFSHYNLWGSMIDHPHPTSAVPTASGGAPSLEVSPHMMSFRGPTAHHQGLSLTLSSQHTSFNTSLSAGEYEHVQASAIPTSTCDDVRIVVPGNHGSLNGIPSFVLGSKYLRAAQEVLEEVVHVGIKGFNQEGGAMKQKMKASINKDSTSPGNRDASSGDGDAGIGGENSGNGKQGGDLSTAQRQELQMKKSKLLTILDEVEQRYRQYHHQMQIVIASFEQAAGYGAAKTYTSLALKTISKQFRFLKDAIASQIRVTSKTLGEDDYLGAKVEGSRLRFVDHQLRQQRALQQLGMIQHNAWRPQRGLPERAVSILRAWLFEHFLHPYPKDSDKVMLAKQTGLTRSQVSNWFINARVRLWKPMVEEMYVEEMKEQEGNNSKEVGSAGTNKSQPQDPGGLRLEHHHHQMKGLQSNNPHHQSFNNQTNTPTDISNYLSGFPFGSSSHHHNHEMQIRSSPKKPRSSEVMNNSPSSILSVDMEMKPGGDHTERSEGNAKSFGMERHRLISSNNGNDNFHNNGGGGGFGGFSMEDMGRYNVADHQLAPRFHGNGVSLTLGLPHNTDNNLPRHGFLSHNMNLTSDGSDFCAMNAPPPSHSNASYENINHIQNRKRFAAQLLSDFVA